jgi:hypothetical protein
MYRLFKMLSVMPLWLLHCIGWALGWVAYGFSATYRRRFNDNAAQAGVGISERRLAVGEAGKMVAELPRVWLGAGIPVQWEGAGAMEAALASTRYLVNPTGRFVIGGPQGDCGLTGRKIIVDTYGGACPHGGGAFSGKDPSKVDRSAAYAARYVAKNIVAAGLAKQCQIQVAYAIGVARPMNVTVYTEGTGVIPDEQIAALVNEHFDLRPKGIIQMLDLLRPIYTKTAAYGHFGREEPEFVWERTDRAAALKKAAGL